MTSADPKLTLARGMLVGALRARVAQQKASLAPEQLAFEQNVARVRDFLAKRGIAVLERRFDDHLEFNGSACCDAAFFDRFGVRLSLNNERLFLRMTLPGHVPPRTRRAALDFLSRVSWDFEGGSLKIDLGYGDVVYEATLASAALLAGNAEDELDRLVGIPLVLFPLLATPLAGVMLGARSPKAAWLDFLAAEGEAELAADIEEAEADCLDNDDDDCDGLVAHAAASTDSRNTKSAASVPAPALLPAGYSLDVLNVETTTPLAKIIEGAKRFQAGKCAEGIDRPRFSILLEGPPGAGKSAFVRHFAHEVGAPFMEVRGSDVLSPYVGKTEKNLAVWFKSAAEKKAILFLDELDSMTWSRSSAMHVWEASQVNELLGQLEKASCIVIGATNFGDRLDPAVLRRFTFKVALGFLTEHGKRQLFERMFKRKLRKKQRLRLASIPNLCPGDFRTVQEGIYYVLEKPTADDYLDALEKESESKTSGRQCQIGFKSAS